MATGAAPVDAAVAGVGLVEADPEDITVGYGGLPNEEGVVQLDAAVMDGATMRAGAVAALERIKHPASVALEVMRRTTRILLVGEGALEVRPRARLPRGEPAHRARAQDLAVLEGERRAQGRLAARRQRGRRPRAQVRSSPSTATRCSARLARSTCRPSLRDGAVGCCTTTSGLVLQAPRSGRRLAARRVRALLRRRRGTRPAAPVTARARSSPAAPTPLSSSCGRASHRRPPVSPLSSAW